MKIILYIIPLIVSLSVLGHEINLENKTIEEIVDTRMKQMSIINNLSQKIYKQLNAKNFDILQENTLKLNHAAIDFKKLFPVNSEGGKAKKLIWEDQKLFNEYHNNFLSDISFMLIDIDEKNITSLKKNFNKMASNCSSCHKKFKKK